MTDDIASDLTDELVADKQLPPSFLTGAAVVQNGGEEEVERQMKCVCLDPVLVLEVDNVVLVDDMEGGGVVLLCFFFHHSVIGSVFDPIVLVYEDDKGTKKDDGCDIMTGHMTTITTDTNTKIRG
eukprot:12800582-Ditylum_brightwellii.AAC.1